MARAPVSKTARFPCSIKACSEKFTESRFNSTNKLDANSECTLRINFDTKLIVRLESKLDILEASLLSLRPLHKAKFLESGERGMSCASY